MNKRLSISILILIISSYLAYGQQIIFHKNINYKANTLLQNLNQDRDSLLLESKDALIQQVDIFSDEFSKSIAINSSKTTIDLKSLPAGNFIIQAKVDKKWIIMYLQKTNDVKLTFTDQNSKIIDNRNFSNNDNSDVLLKNSKSMFYWVVYERNSGFGSSRSMRLEYKETVAKLISKNKLELNSSIGKHNKLVIYEVYDKSKFMNNQFKNSTFYRSTLSSKFFNAIPLYSSYSQNLNDTNS